MTRASSARARAPVPDPDDEVDERSRAESRADLTATHEGAHAPSQRASSASTMRASVLNVDPGLPAISVGQWPRPQLQPGWVLVRVVRAGLNRLDQMTVAERTDLPARAVIGSDASGVVVAVADDVTTSSLGDEVVVFPSLWWGPDDDVQSEEMEILGYPTPGTHAELVAVRLRTSRSSRIVCRGRRQLLFRSPVSPHGGRSSHADGCGTGRRSW